MITRKYEDVLRPGTLWESPSPHHLDDGVLPPPALLQEIDWPNRGDILYVDRISAGLCSRHNFMVKVRRDELVPRALAADEWAARLAESVTDMRAREREFIFRSKTHGFSAAFLAKRLVQLEATSDADLLRKHALAHRDYYKHHVAAMRGRADKP